VKLSQAVLELHLSQPFESNKGSLSTVRQVLVQLECQGRTGLGTALLARADPSPTTIMAALDRCAPLLAGASPLIIEQLLDRLQVALADTPAALAALDMALHDLLGQHAGVPVHHLLGLAASPLPPTALSLGALSTTDVVDRARHLAAWPILKLKMTARTDVQCVEQLRQVYAGRIWIDGNGAWDPDGALAAADTFSRCGVELIEQPIPPGTPDRLRYVRERSPLPIVADEDCCTPDDVSRLAGCVDAINIKLAKCGGLRHALDMIGRARRAGLAVMLGCRTESVLGITAMAQLGPLADYLDLDGHLDLIDDPYTGLQVHVGQLTLPTTPGLGVHTRATH
jgi:L-alanine-DL-glutamate epimerase-like enolase superfamily enzyme